MKQVLLTHRAANAVCQALVVTTFAVSRVVTGWSIEDAPSQGAWPHSGAPQASGKLKHGPGYPAPVQDIY